MMKGKRMLKFSPMIAGFIGVVVSILISIALLLVGTGLISGDHMQIGGGKYFAVCVQAIAGLVGGIVGGSSAGEKAGLVCCAASGGYLLFLTIVSLLFFNGLDSTYLWGICAIGIGTVCAIVLCSKSVNRKKKTRKRFR